MVPLIPLPIELYGITFTCAKPVQQFRKKLGLCIRIIHTRQDAILDSDDAPGALLKCFRGGDDVCNRIPPIAWHQFRSGCVVRRVQRQGQVHVQIRLCQPLDAGHDADGGDGHLAPTDTAHVRISDATGGGEYVVEVVHWLAHPHEDDRLEPPADRRRGALEMNELLDDLAGVETAIQPIARAGAEVTSHGAADL